MRDQLVIVPCCKKKIWDDGETKGPIAAGEAYTSTMFRFGIQFAEASKSDLIILSAKYGYIREDYPIEPYDVTFKKRSSYPITVKELSSQVLKYDILSYKKIIGLGGSEYRKAITESLYKYDGLLQFPLAGFSMGYYLKHLKRAIKDGGFYLEGFYLVNGRPTD